MSSFKKVMVKDNRPEFKGRQVRIEMPSPKSKAPRYIVVLNSNTNQNKTDTFVRPSNNNK